eukprot:10945234-Karenia_brevis.AAC.1
MMMMMMIFRLHASGLHRLNHRLKENNEKRSGFLRPITVRVTPAKTGQVATAHWKKDKMCDCVEVSTWSRAEQIMQQLHGRVYMHEAPRGSPPRQQQDCDD